MIALIMIVAVLVADAVRFVLASLRSRQELAAENLSLPRQLALYEKRGQKARRVDAAMRVTNAIAAITTLGSKGHLKAVPGAVTTSARLLGPIDGIRVRHHDKG